MGAAQGAGPHTCGADAACCNVAGRWAFPAEGKDLEISLRNTNQPLDVLAASRAHRFEQGQQGAVGSCKPAPAPSAAEGHQQGNEVDAQPQPFRSFAALETPGGEPQRRMVERFVKSLIKGIRILVISTSGDLIECIISVDREITMLLLERAKGTEANRRTIPFKQIHKICQHHPILPPGAFQGSDLKLRVDDLCVALLLKDGQMLSFSFENGEQRKTFAWCISSFVDGQKKHHRAPASGHKVTPRSQRVVPECRAEGSGPESKGFTPYDFGLEDDDNMSLPTCQPSPVPTLPEVVVV
mmetsp:Transcript_84063/g.195501  ORF Transcript_84063/g.195501 Transcript_84063/m.195501 type:complete len:298 (+) Transcript_84063:80-973(+)